MSYTHQCHTLTNVFQNSRVTFLGGTTSPRFQASGSGDWSLYASGALYLSGTEKITVEDNKVS
jgi:hypothetical protein